jgi:hypothetical protein
MMDGEKGTTKSAKKGERAPTIVCIPAAFGYKIQLLLRKRGFRDRPYGRLSKTMAPALLDFLNPELPNPET